MLGLSMPRAAANPCLPALSLCLQLGTMAVVGAMSQTWLHPLLRKMLPAQGEVRSRH